MYKPQVPSTSLRAKSANPIHFFLFLTVRAASLVDAMEAIGYSGRFRPFCQWTRNFFLLLLVLLLAANVSLHPSLSSQPQ